MKTFFNKETYRWEWHINKWYEKVVYVFGVLYVACIGIGIVMAIAQSLAGN